MRKKEGTLNSVGSKAQWFSISLYSITLLFIIGFLWLFIGNIDQTNKGAVLDLIRNPWFRRSAKLSLVTSSITTIIAMVTGIPAAYALSRFAIPGKTWIDILFSSIIVLPASTIGLLLMITFQYEPILKIQQALGIRVVHSLPSIIIAQLILSLALGIKAWRVAFDDVDPRYEYVARSLGSGRLRTFIRVTLPVARTGLLSGIILAWTRAMAEFGAVLMLSSTFRARDESQFSVLVKFLGLHRADILPVGMWMEMESGNTQSGYAMAFMLVLITLLSVYAFNHMGSKSIWHS